ncbi:MAG: DUF3489 domain-containing protein [Rickettsiales bacterium]|nr:DUF3489 domain-containing protein [Rickettsiales bacterium]
MPKKNKKIIKKPELKPQIEPTIATEEKEVSTPENSSQKPISKKQIMLILLKEGTTIEKLMQMTGWQKHTVHGSLANLKKQLNLQIETSKNEIGERFYKVAS